MAVRLQPVRVATGLDEEGMLVFTDDRLVAVLVHLSHAHDELGVAGRWYLETGYGLPLAPRAPTFADLEAAQSWIVEHLARSR
jgi:hypothetical protein